MFKIDINYSVQVTGFAVPGSMTQGDRAFGLSFAGGAGTFLWTAKGGELLEKWSSGFSKSIDLRRGGKFCTVAGGEIYLDNTAGMAAYIKRWNLNLEGAKIVIKYGEATAPSEVFVGVVTGVSYTLNTLTVAYDDPATYRNAVIGAPTASGDPAPVLFGEHTAAKLELVEDSVEDVEEDLYLEYADDRGLGIFGSNFPAKHLFFKLPPGEDDLMHYMRLAAAIRSSGKCYAYCVEGNGKGLAYKIADASFMLLPSHFLHIELEESLYTAGNSDGDRVTSVFRPAVETGGSITGATFQEDVPFDEYEQISVFRLVIVTKRYTLGGSVGGNPVIYALIDDEYIPVPAENFHIDTSGVTVDMLLLPRSFRDDFGSVDLFVQLKGLDFTFDDDYFNDGTYDKDVFSLPVEGVDDSWAHFASASSTPNNMPVHLYAARVAPYDIDPDPTYISVVHDSISNDSRIVFDNNNTGKMLVQVIRNSVLTGGGRYYGISRMSFGIPFSFVFERLASVSEVMLNFNIEITLSLLGADVDAHPELINYLMPPNNGNLQTYEILTALEGAALAVNKHYRKRRFLVDVLQDESVGSITPNSGVLYSRHIINTCYDLNGLRDSDPQPGIEALLVSNGNFWRQDIYTSEEYIQLQGSAPSGWTRYMVGYEAIRNGGDGSGGFFSIPDKVKGPLRFQSMLSLSGGFLGALVPAGAGGYLSLYHGIILKNIQCLAKIGINPADDFYVAATAGPPESGVSPVQSWTQVYEDVLKRQNYSTSFIPSFTRPPGGWGTGYPSNNPNDYLSVIDAPAVSAQGVAFPVRRQLFTRSELETQNIKDELLRAAWRGGYTDRLGRETIFGMMGEQVTYTEIGYKDILQGTLGSLGAVRKEDIFCEPSLKYNYDIGRDTYLGSIAVTGIATNMPEITGDNSITPVQKSILLDSSARLYRRYGLINDPPQSLTESKWIFRDSDAYVYLRTWLDWMGAAYSASDPDFERREISFTLPVETALRLEMDIGRFVEVEIPLLAGSFKGFITSCAWSLDKGREEARCKALIKVPAGVI